MMHCKSSPIATGLSECGAHLGKIAVLCERDGVLHHVVAGNEGWICSILHPKAVHVSDTVHHTQFKAVARVCFFVSRKQDHHFV